MAIHPPLLYLGFVGLAVPFALTVDALVRGRLDEAWLRLSRSWTLGPWVVLTLGLITGAWWSYAVLGWGGYWAWDPVENVALLPWLTATAFIHSAMVGRRRGALVAWNVTLISASFALTLFATLVTRSGILDSVHAFTRSAIGPLLIGLLGAVLVGTIGLLALRLPAGGDARLGARGRAFLLNNLLFTAVAATVFFGTVFPLLAEALAATRVSVGAPYFERLVGPLAVGLLVLIGIGPALPWGDSPARSRAAFVPGAVAAAVAAAALGIGAAQPGAIAGAAAGAFGLAQSASLLVRRLWHHRRRGSGGGRLRAGNGRAIGGLISHTGFALLALAVLASATGKREAVVVLEPGATREVLGQRLSFAGSQERPGPNRRIIAADVTLGEGPRLSPALNIFAASTQAIASPAIVPGPSADIYVTLLDLDPVTGVATLRVGIHPFVSWIWPSGALIALGGALAALAVPLGERRRVPRPADEHEPASAGLTDTVTDVVAP